LLLLIASSVALRIELTINAGVLRWTGKQNWKILCMSWPWKTSHLYLNVRQAVNMVEPKKG
jgi:hypothetical protein